MDPFEAAGWYDQSVTVSRHSGENEHGGAILAPPVGLPCWVEYVVTLVPGPGGSEETSTVTFHFPERCRPQVTVGSPLLYRGESLTVILVGGSTFGQATDGVSAAAR